MAGKTYPASGLALFVLSLIYLCMELVFNRQLLDISSTVRSAPAAVNHIQYFGRALSGIGFTLLVLGIFQQFGFKISGRRQWAVFFLVALLCLLPLGLAFGPDAPQVGGMACMFLPLIGVYLVLACRGRVRFAVIMGLVLLAWPAMFYGQKLAVERFVISPATTEDRLNAHYILLLRSGVDDCVIRLEGTQFCDGGGPTDAEKRATRAVMSALFMLNTGAVFNGLSFSRDQIIESISAQDMWFSSKEYYRKYLQQVADKREQYEHYLDAQYYLPYKQASELYKKNYDKAATLYKQARQPGNFAQVADDAARAAEKEIDQGWQKYQKADNAYSKAAIGVTSGVEQGIYAHFCNGHESLCDKIAGKMYKGLTVDEAMAQARAAADEKFTEQTGYPPGLRSREEFLQNQKTQDALRAHIESRIQEQIEGYTLPAGWQYDSATFRNDFLRLLQGTAQTAALEAGSRVQKAWKGNVQSKLGKNIPPGLSRDEFFDRLGGDPLPPLKDLVMSENDFREKYIVPINRKIADNALKQIKDEAPDYANDRPLAAQGKDYIRALYIPTIALCFSVVIVVLTISRYLSALAEKAVLRLRIFRALPRRVRACIRPLCWMVFLALALTLPYLWMNPYISTVAYQKYYRLAREKAAVPALLLDWVVHVQPIVYRAGAPMAGRVF